MTGVRHEAFACARSIVADPGALAFVVPVPHRDDHSVKVGDAKFTVQTENREKLPPAVGIVLIGGGVLSLVSRPAQELV